MVELDSFLKKEKSKDEEGPELVRICQATLYDKDAKMVTDLAEKYDVPKASILRYFVHLGISAHVKRAKIRKELDPIVDRKVILQGMIEEIEKRLSED